MLSLLYSLFAWTSACLISGAVSLRKAKETEDKVKTYENYVASKERARNNRAQIVKQARAAMLQSQTARTASLYDENGEPIAAMPFKQEKKIKKKEVAPQRVTEKNLPLSDSAFYDNPRLE